MGAANVSVGSSATEMGSPRDVRLSSNSGGITDIPALRVCATTGPLAADPIDVLRSSCFRPERRQHLESRLQRRIWQPQRMQSPRRAVHKRMRPPTQIGLEIASRRSDPWPPIIVENNQP